MSKSAVQCSACGAIFQKENKQINEAKKFGYGMYCSPQCQREAKTNTVEAECSNCGDTFETKPWIIAKSKTGNVYCSRSCANAANNKLFKWGGIAYEEAMQRADSKCEVCGYSNDLFLKIHHNDGNRFNTDLDNLVVVCPTHLAELEYTLMFNLSNDDTIVTEVLL